jgi:hypothetical protein
MMRPFLWRVIFHSAQHFSKCSVGGPYPSYFSCWLFLCSVPNLMHSNRLHWYQSLIVSLCVPHHLASVALSAISSAKSLKFSNTSSSHYAKNTSRSFTLWKLGGSLSSVSTHLTARSILAHILVETSCSLCCNFSKPIFESVTHEVMLCQLSILSVVGFT